jgi:polar amino acid transport system substrate-binding protein
MNRRQILQALLATAPLGIGSPARALGSPDSSLDRIQSQKMMKVGWATWYPYIFRDPKSNDIQGISFDLAEQIGKAMGVKVTWVEDSWATLPAGLQAGKFDVANLMAITPPREAVMSFTNSVTRHSLSLLAPKEEIAKAKSWQEWDRPDVKITVTLGSVGDMFVTQQFKKAEIVRLKTFPENVLALQTGRVNAFGATLDALTVLEKDLPQFAVLSSSFGNSEVAFGVTKGDDALVARLNQAIGEFKNSGQVKQMIVKYGLDASFAVE